MQRPLTFAFVLLLALAAALFWWLQDETPASHGGPASPRTAPAAAAPTADAATGSSPATTPATTEREAAQDAAAAPAAGPDLLRVFARWPGDVPAADVRICVRTRSYRRGYQLVGRAVTDDAGLATFPGLERDQYELQSDRGDRVEIDVTGGTQDVVFELAGGIAVTGRVVAPDDHPVAGASVWLQTRDTLWTGGRVFATTGADGRFALERVPPTVSLGAFAKGFVRSELLDLDVVDTSKPPVDVTLRLLPGGGELVGVVVDDHGPVAGAVVGLGKEDGHYDMRGDRIIERWSVRSAETDARGRFAFDGLAPGEQPIAVRAVGRGFWRSTCTIVAGETTAITATLQTSGTIRGVVRDANDQPMPGARISCYDLAPRTPFLAGGQIDFDATFGYLTATARDDGAFEVHDVTAGTAHVFAQPGARPKWGEPVPYARAELAIAPGAVAEWNPVISDGHTIEGIVYYRDGHPMGNVFITLIDEKTQRQHVVTNDQDGRFRFVNLDATTYTARVQYWDAPRDAPRLELSGIAPDRGRVELKAPYDKPVKLAPGSVLGRVDDVAGRIRNPKAARVALMSDRNWFHDNGALVDGAFRFDDVEPCRFRLALMENDATLANSDWFELLPGAVLDTGVLRTVPGGAVHLTITRVDGTDAAPKIWFSREGAARGTSLAIGTAAEAVVDSLTPGVYKVSAWAEDMAYVDTSVTVTAGATAELPLRFEPGRACRIGVWLPEGERIARYRYVVTGADGRVQFERSGTVAGSTPLRPFPVVVSPPFGEWTLTFTGDDRLHGTLQFRVTAGDTPLELRLDLVAK